MGEKNGQDSSVKVVDKRRFDSEGDARTGAVSEEKNKSCACEHSQNMTSQVQSGHNEQAEPVTFSAFVMGLFAQVLALLGEFPNPETNTVTVNIDAARQTIDILSVLQEKTRGNLTPDEVQMMDDVVHSLKLAFVKKVEELKKK